MAEQIIADASKLIALDDSLRSTIIQLDFVVDEVEEMICDTSNQILNLLELWKNRQEQAYEKLIIAREALERAELRAQSSEDGIVPYHFYQAVEVCQANYDEITGVCEQIERIYDEFLLTSSSCKGSIASSRQEIISILQKSSHILTQYAELVKKSVAVTSGGAKNIGSNSPQIVYSGNLSKQSETMGICNDSSISENRYQLPYTNQTWTTNSDGSMIFNTPLETGEKLDSKQGKVFGYWGTCGLVSCTNVLRLAGYPATEREVVKYASSTSAGFCQGKLCTTNSFPENNGGTSAKSRQMILKHFGIDSELKDATVDAISDAISEGRGVIISVYAGMLYKGWSNYRDLHAITVTSVKKDKTGNILGFYVCDSGTGGVDNSKFYTAMQIENALSGRPMNVTSIIR